MKKETQKNVNIFKYAIRLIIEMFTFDVSSNFLNAKFNTIFK